MLFSKMNLNKFMPVYRGCAKRQCQQGRHTSCFWDVDANCESQTAPGAPLGLWLPVVRAKAGFLFLAFAQYQAPTILSLQMIKWAVFCCLACAGGYICLYLLSIPLKSRVWKYCKHNKHKNKHKSKMLHNHRPVMLLTSQQELGDLVKVTSVALRLNVSLNEDCSPCHDL